MYTLWNEEQSCREGLPVSFPPENDEGNWLPIVMPPPRATALQTLVWEKVNGSVVGRWDGSADLLAVPATIDQINERHRELEVMPVMVYGNLMDANERSEKRIQDAIEAFDDLPVHANVVEMVGAEKIIKWKDAGNNSHPLNKAALIAVKAELIKQRAIRATVLFAQLQEYKANGCTLRDLQEWV